MDKVLVKLYVPKVDRCFDVKIPLDKKLYKVIYMFIKAVYDLTDGAYIPQSSPFLYEKWTARRFDVNLTARECYIENGAELILM